jgi:hypothetical protein
LRDLAWDWSIFLYIGYETETDADGRFVFDKVPEGEYVASLQDPAWQVNGQPNVKAIQTPAVVRSGQTATVRLAAEGCTVLGRLRVGLPAGAFSWTNALAIITTDVAVPPEPVRGDYLSNQSHMAARARYTHDPAVLAALRAVKNYVGQVDSAGNLLFEQIPPGRYICEVKLFQNRKGRFTPGFDDARLQARLRVPITVPETPVNSEDCPALDLGELVLESL